MAQGSGKQDVTPRGKNMPKIVLHYFPFKGLGEQIRLLLAYGGEGFEDNHVSFDWSSFKPKTPFGQVPVLEIDGKQYAQSSAIARYLGHRYGLAGADMEEDFIIDQNVEFFNEIRTKAAEYSRSVYPTKLRKLDAIIQANNGHMACGKLTWADFVFAGLFDQLKTTLSRPDLGKEFPSFKKLEQLVYSLPRVKAFVESTPAYY